MHVKWGVAILAQAIWSLFCSLERSVQCVAAMSDAFRERMHRFVEAARLAAEAEPWHPLATFCERVCHASEMAVRGSGLESNLKQYNQQLRKEYAAHLAAEAGRPQPQTPPRGTKRPAAETPPNVLRRRCTSEASALSYDSPLLTEADLHHQVVRFIRSTYVNILIIPGLGENQITTDMRLESWRKGYTKGQPDLMIPHPVGNFIGLAIELKKPGTQCVPSESQLAVLKRLSESGWLILISDSLEDVLEVLAIYCDNIV
jgi:hypothetical protein